MDQFRNAVLVAVAGFGALSAAGQATFELIGGGFAATDVSGDGSVIVGNSVNDFLYQQARWTRDTGFVLLGRATGPVFGTGGGAPQISYDGTRVSSTITGGNDSYITAGVWTEGQGWQEIFPPLLPGAMLLDLSYGSSWAISGDGGTVAGLFWRDRLTFGGGSAHAFSWNETDGATDLGGSPDANSSRANGVNADGSVVVGWESAAQGQWQPAVWVDGVKTILADTPVSCEARAVSDDGTVIVGWSYDANNAMRVAARWVWDGADWNEELLGILPGTPIGPLGGRSYASAISGDGSVILGTNQYISNGPFSTQTGFIWTEAGGMVDIRDLLSDHGLSLPAGFQIDGLAGVTQDGSTIVGYGSYPVNYPDYHSFILDLGTLCPADVNGDGALSPADFTAWVAAFNASAIECDQNGDGLCTPADFSAWVANFNAGCD